MYGWLHESALMGGLGDAIRRVFWSRKYLQVIYYLVLVITGCSYCRRPPGHGTISCLLLDQFLWSSTVQQLSHSAAVTSLVPRNSSYNAQIFLTLSFRMCSPTHCVVGLVGSGSQWTMVYFILFGGLRQKLVDVCIRAVATVRFQPD